MKRSIALGLLPILLVSLVLGCASDRPTYAIADDVGFAGTELVYRFPVGRTYRASYGTDDVSFELIEPRLEVQPSETMPYVSKVIRKDVYLVVWDSEAFHTTFVVDLARRELHASARRSGADRFIGTAEILSVRRQLNGAAPD